LISSRRFSQKRGFLREAAVSNADTMAERMFYFWEFIIKKDNSADEDAIEAPRLRHSPHSIFASEAALRIIK
jgi:hypothetical protein